MSRKSKMQAVRESKDARAKKLAIGGAVLLAVVLAYEVPHVLKSSGGSAAPAATTTTDTTGATATTPSATTPSTTPSGTAAAAPMPTTGSTKLTSSDVAPKRSKSQLYSFSEFQGKDPFVQQVTDSSATAGPSAAGTSAQKAASASGTITGTPAPAQLSAARTLAKAGSATISVNGKAETIRIGAGFPSSNPLFKLVSVSHGVARIGIANGSYASGAHTVSLTGGRALTFVDTADNVRYRLRLVTAS